jgi:hypothetical protein
MPIAGASEKLPCILYDNGGHVFNVKHPDYGAQGDGTTNDSPAIQAAITAAKAAPGGGIVYLPPGQYRCSTSLNVANTGSPSVSSLIFRGGGQRSTQLNAQCTGKALFDCTGTSFVVWEDMAISGNASYTPSCAILMARTTSLQSAGNHIVSNVLIYGNFSKASIYNYASEEMNICNGCTINNAAIGGKSVCITKTNIMSATSDYASIATTGISTTIHRIVDSAITHYATSGASDCIYVDGIASLTIDHCFLLSNGGRSFLWIDTTVSTSTNIAMRNCGWDGNATTYGVVVAGSNALAELILENIYDVGVIPFTGTPTAPTGGMTVYAQDGTVISSLRLLNVFSNTSYYRLYEVDYSDLEFQIGDTVWIKYVFTGCTMKVTSTKLTLARPDYADGSVAYYRDTGQWASLKQSLDHGDVTTDNPTQRWDSAISAARTVTLPANAVSARGQKFRIVRTTTAAFTLTVQDAASTALKVMPSAVAAYTDVEFNGTTWKLSAYGAL